MLCRNCGAECVDCPTKRNPAIIACPICDERGCQHCERKGNYEITDCPQKQIDAELVQFLDLADMFEKGIPPIAGGSLDQASWFLKAFHFLKSEENRITREATSG